MSYESTYVERLGRELVAAGRRLQSQEQRQFAGAYGRRPVGAHGRQLAGARRRRPARERLSHVAGDLRRHAALARPEVSRRMRLQATFALCGIALIAALTLAVLGLGAGAQRAYAGWTPTPTQPASGQVAAAEATCLHEAAISASRELQRREHPNLYSAPERGAEPIGSNPNEPKPTPIVQAGEWHRVLSDTRGPYTMLAFEAAEGRAKMTCLSSESRPLYGNGSYDWQARSAPAGTIEVFYEAKAGGAGAEGLEQGKPYNYIDGKTGPGVTAVTLDLEGGEHVQATVENGWFLAWWPGTEKATEAEVATASETNIQQLSGSE